MLYQHLRLSTGDGVARVTLARPDVRNAFNADMIRELTDAFARVGADPAVHAVVLSGEGKTFSGGADLNWMRAALECSEEENVADALAMSDMFRTIDRCPKPTVARVHGAALGGGVGLCAVCDIVVSASDAVFGFTEVKLGILPAVISPFAIAKIGASQARALFLTGERFGVERAMAIGLVHHCADADELDLAVDRMLGELRSAGPRAASVAKRMIEEVLALDYDASRELTARRIAAQRVSEEGQEGIRAFLDKRKAAWVHQ
ncbi:MAG TPA: enoyl-CoA hydratase-related protein [Candidatus Dormibacteraeota bacterium]|nr:enoyl-CoA hydratase-related protein [Candidatus Dormibacteraeota bacterium]